MTLGTPEVNEDFVDMLMALDANKAEFLIVGAYALAAMDFLGQHPPGLGIEASDGCEVPWRLQGSAVPRNK